MNSQKKPVKKTRKALKEETRHRILMAATEIFAAKGLESFTMNKISKAAGISQPSFYVHFESVVELLKTIIQTHRENYAEPLSRAMNELAEKLGENELHDVIHNFMKLEFDNAIKYPAVFCLGASQNTLNYSELQEVLNAEQEVNKEDYVKFFKIVVANAGLKISDEKMKMGVDSVLAANETLMMGCIKGRYQSKKEAINLATNNILQQISYGLSQSTKA